MFFSSRLIYMHKNRNFRRWDMSVVFNWNSDLSVRQIALIFSNTNRCTFHGLKSVKLSLHRLPLSLGINGVGNGREKIRKVRRFNTRSRFHQPENREYADSRNTWVLRPCSWVTVLPESDCSDSFPLNSGGLACSCSDR